MAIPDYQTIMLPLLEIAADDREHDVAELVSRLADKFKLTIEEKDELLPSGSESGFRNKVRWARFYLIHAGLLETKKRGLVNITKRGVEALSEKPTTIDVKSLYQYPEFSAYMGTVAKPKNEGVAINEQTPEELIENSYQKIREELSQQVLTQVKNATPSFFEKLVVELLVNMGYGGSLRDAGQVIGKSGDEGIDGTIKEDRLGLVTGSWKGLRRSSGGLTISVLLSADLRYFPLNCLPTGSIYFIITHFRDLLGSRKRNMEYQIFDWSACA